MNKQTLLARIAGEYLQVPTLKARRSDSLDFHTVAVWNIEAALIAAFEAGVNSAQKQNADIDVHALLEERRQVAVIWSIDDVQHVRNDLDDDQAWQVLQRCDRLHDCELGFNWLLIWTVAEDLFPAPDEGDGE